MNKKLLALSLLLLSSSAYANMRDRMTQLSAGMDRDQVISQLGKPDGVTVKGNMESIQYSNRLITGWAWDRADYYAVFEDNKLVSWGTGEVRAKNSPVMVVIPLNTTPPQQPMPMSPGEFRRAQER